ncbi:hypothetical protein [Mycolicibacterium mageritense]|uniref:Uncharacterized protein n=1 Tax=Mycolicibacterium mageritense TaxID=53462 RepID=A0AAI8XPU9_MYCME|nr:hypothetical protein [Mycolicibacterium mageritense]BBX35431.1 hypothetical protein MMAGJ_47130 [Mycolicibacterium mageritense]BDY30327.1 hypothetical protein hbim_04270 [Mycolicibacterium mageritense]GJJ18505.1 hypothetical protein MTY414_21780 [Mycolicibacterium mageritense]CDO20061.1 hypothetical protein BN978_00513 [Mycolicibacterium mageritense DSM 44476 = CIP 104973]
MAEISPTTLRRVLIVTGLVLGVLILIIALVYAMAFIILAPMMA